MFVLLSIFLIAVYQFLIAFCHILLYYPLLSMMFEYILVV